MALRPRPPTHWSRHNEHLHVLHQWQWRFVQRAEADSEKTPLKWASPFSEQELITPALNGLILPGITRDSILTLTRQWGRFKVTEGPITMPQICKLIKEERVSWLFNVETQSTPTNRIISAVGIVRRWNGMHCQPHRTDQLFGRQHSNSNFGTVKTSLHWSAKRADWHSIRQSGTSLGQTHRLTVLRSRPYRFGFFFKSFHGKLWITNWSLLVNLIDP